MKIWAAFLGLASAAMIAGALWFQYVDGLAPCKLCIWQRWPHAIAVMIGLLAFYFERRAFFLLGALVMAVSVGIGLYHAGVELAIFEGPSTCTAASLNAMSTDDLLEHILAAPLVRCDEIAWSFCGLSMATWNAIISLGLMIGWAVGWRKTR